MKYLAPLLIALALTFAPAIVDTITPRNMCDTQAECDAQMDLECANHGGVDKYTPITTRNDGTRECSADCEDGSMILGTCGIDNP
jgi:hypothetical protein